MDKEQIDFIKSLDPKGVSGTIQSVVMSSNIEKLPYVKALEFILKATLMEKERLIEDNKQLSIKVNLLGGDKL